MAETVAGTYATLAGIEIVNDFRTYSYLKNGLGPTSLNVSGSCGSCENLLSLLDCDDITEYVSPAADLAPWYTPSIPESAEFLGFMVSEFEGLDSPFQRKITETVRNGGVLSRSRLNTRELRWRGYLFGGSCSAVQYGLRWYAKTLARFDSACKDCFGEDLEFLFTCPNELGTTDPFRLAKGVGLIEGPTIESERKICSSTSCESSSTGCVGGSCIIEIEFFLASTQPYFYGKPVNIYECVPVLQGAMDRVTDASEECPPFNCSDSLFDDPGDCQRPLLPPIPTYSSPCFDNTILPALDTATYLSVSRDSWGFLEEVVPVISIKNNSGFSVMGAKLSFYVSADGNPCADLIGNPPLCDLLCDDLIIGLLPANSEFYIDGRTRKMSLICNSVNTAFPGERHTNGPWSWPSFSQYGFCMEVLFNEATAADVCVSVSLVPRTF